MADSKLRYTIQFSILMLCAKYQEAGLCGSPDKCDRNYLVNKFAYVHNIQSRVKQKVDMPQFQNCVTWYSSPYWCSVPNIRKLACVVPEKKCDRNFLWRRHKTTQDDRSDPYMSPPLKRAGDTIRKSIRQIELFWNVCIQIDDQIFILLVYPYLFHFHLISLWQFWLAKTNLHCIYRESAFIFVMNKS